MKKVVDANRRRFARHLRGRGLEIGALSNPMPLPFATEVLYSDVLTGEQLDALYPGSRHPDIVSDSETFPSVEDDSFDFVVANHVLEHLTDPLAALIEWRRILRPQGLLLLSLPDKRYTFDFSRPRTSIEHLISDHLSDAPPSQRNDGHLLEWAEHVQHLPPGSERFMNWVGEQRARGYSVHNHVWVLEDLLAVFDYLSTTEQAHFALKQWSNTSLLGNEFTLLLEKSAAASLTPFRRARHLATATAPIHAIAARGRRFLRLLLGRSLTR